MKVVDIINVHAQLFVPVFLLLQMSINQTLASLGNLADGSVNNSITV